MDLLLRVGSWLFLGKGNRCFRFAVLGREGVCYFGFVVYIKRFCWKEVETRGELKSIVK